LLSSALASFWSITSAEDFDILFNIILMSFFNLQAVLIFLGGILLSTPGDGNKTEGYRCLIRYEDGFIVAGSGGQIVWISASGKKTKSEKFPGENFNCLLEYNQIIVAAGERGSILMSSNKGIFRKVESGTVRNINSLAVFNGIIIAGADQGEIIRGDASGSFKKYPLDLKGNIVSVAARTSDCYGVTNEGEIIHSTDGIKWDIIDFNKFYSCFYRPCHFTKVLVTDNRIAVAGIHDDGSPVLVFSSQGSVWTERPLNYTDDQGMAGYLADTPNDIFYDDPGDQFFLACSRGRLMKLPSCSQCNKLAVISREDLEGISKVENNLMIVGGNYLVKTVSLSW
jgi:hypothetical protein